MRHFQRWGAVYILIVAFLGSWVGQFIAQADEIAFFGWDEFWAATFQNWQSAFMALAVQALLVAGFAHVMFTHASDDTRRLEAKIDLLLLKQGIDARPDDELP